MNLPHIPTITSSQPLVLITGFLGAGKTTLLRELLQEAKKHSLTTDVILNDYADATIDSETLKKFTDKVEPLTATCACCEGLDFLLELSVKSSESATDLLLIELNGTADPVPIVESFTLMEEKLKLHPRWQVCVVDVNQFGNRGQYRDIELLQLQTASHIYLSHIEREEELSSVVDGIRKINPYAPILTKDDLIGAVLKLAKNHVKRIVPQKPAVEEFKLHGPSHSHQQHQSHEFAACQILMPEYASEDVIRAWLAILPQNVLRVKLLIGVSGTEKHRFLFERVGNKVSQFPQTVRLSKSVPNSAILIGPDLNLPELQSMAEQYF